MLTEGAIGGWAERFEELMQQLGPRFSRSDLRQRAAAYLRGLLSPVQRKNAWQLSEAVGDPTPYGIQRLLRRASWEAESVRDDLRAYGVEHLGDSGAVLSVDETGCLKKGRKSAGVARPYSGTAGRVENSQIGVFLAYRSAKGTAFLDRELSLPKVWMDDRPRCREAGIPDETGFATQPELARRMLRRALLSGVPAAWVTADEVYGSDSKFRRLLEEHALGFVVAVSCQQRLFLARGYGRVEDHAAALPKRAWKRISCGSGTKGERFYEWAFLPWPVITAEGFEKGLLVRRSLREPGERAYFLTHAPCGTTLPELVRVAGTRWAVEAAFEPAKQETGLAHYEVRTWAGWHRHITLALLAHAFLAVLRAQASRPARAKKSPPVAPPRS